MPRYHHGNLRGALIAVATDLLAEEGIHPLSLRKIAQKAGVSHNAPYMHFADKEALLAAIAEEGFRLLLETVEESVAKLDKSTRERLIAASTAYVNFALNYPSYLQVMFYPYDLDKYSSLREASQSSLDYLFNLVKAGQESKELIPGDAYEMTKTIWAMVHGVATLSTAYKTSILRSENASTEETIAVFIDRLLNGIAV
jgi:AcrR family transcriptional regulator